jgi:hypothetical protein
VCPILEAKGVWAVIVLVVSAQRAKRRDRRGIRITFVKNPLEDVRETRFHDIGTL